MSEKVPTIHYFHPFQSTWLPAVDGVLQRELLFINLLVDLPWSREPEEHTHLGNLGFGLKLQLGFHWFDNISFHHSGFIPNNKSK